MQFLEWIASASRIRTWNFQPLQFAAVCAPPLLLQALSVFAPVAIMNLQPLRIRILLCAWTVIREAGIHEEDEMTRRDEMRTREVRVVEERESRVNSDGAFHREQMGEQMNKWSHFFTVTKKILYIVTRDYHKQVFYFAHSIWVRKFRASSSFCLFSSSSSRRFASGSYKEFEACVRRLHCLKKVCMVCICIICIISCLISHPGWHQTLLLHLACPLRIFCPEGCKEIHSSTRLLLGDIIKSIWDLDTKKRQNAKFLKFLLKTNSF